jgi:hypothetical protein
MSKEQFILTDFSEIQRDFNRLFPNQELHEVESFGFLKLAQHAHSYSKIQAQNKKGEFPFQAWKFRFKQLVKNSLLRKLNIQNSIEHEALLLPKRVDYIHGKADSILVKRLLESELSHVQIWDTLQKFSFAHIQIPSKSFAMQVSPDVQQMHQALCKWLRRIAEIIDAEDFAYYTGAAATFLHEFMFWNTVISGSKLEKLYLITHYHQEGLIAAARNHGVHIIELQHGLISKNDLYYVYEKKFADVYKKSFFPNEFWCFGEYWKRKFFDSADNGYTDIVVKGDFRWREKLAFTEKRNVIVIATQKNMFEAYAMLIYKLDDFLQNYPDWNCEIKLHPLEKNVEAYSMLHLSERMKLLPIETNLEHVLGYCKIQVSIYSTTFYDALGQNIVNFAWSNSGFSNDYVREVIEDGVAYSFELEDNLIEKYQSLGVLKFIDREFVFHTFIQD